MNRTATFFNQYRDELILFIIAVALYLPGIGWGIPYATHPDRVHGWATDAITPLEPLTEAYHLMQSEPRSHVGYPVMHFLLLAAVYSPYLLFLLIAGGLTNPSPVFPFGFSDPIGSLQALEYIAKVVSICMAAGTVVVAYRLAHLLWGQTAARIAGVLTILPFSSFYYAKTGNVDIAVLFWTALGVLAFTQIAIHGFSNKSAICLGLFTAFATATKDQGAGAFLLMPPVLLILDYRRAKQTGTPMSWKPYACGLTACIVGYLAATGMIISPDRNILHLQFVLGGGSHAADFRFPATLASYWGMTQEMLIYLVRSIGPLVSLLAIAGVCLASSPLRVRQALLTPFAGHCVMLAIIRATRFRYTMPLSFIACIFAAYPIALAMRSKTGWHRGLAWAAVVVIGTWQLTLAGDLTYQMLNDSRYEATAWLEKHTQPGDVIAAATVIDFLPQTKPGVELISFLHSESPIDDIANYKPDVIIITPNGTTIPGGFYPASFPSDVFDSLLDGSIGYQKIAFFKTESLIKKQRLDYPTVNPPIHIFTRMDS